MSISVTPPLKAELKIYFGLNDDDLLLVKNIKVNLVHEINQKDKINGGEEWIKAGYSQVKAIKTCDALHIIGKHPNPDENGEMIIPMSNIAMLRIDWIPGKDPTKA